LDLIDDPSLVINERNLIESQNICDFFHYSITPIESKFRIIINRSVPKSKKWGVGAGEGSHSAPEIPDYKFLYSLFILVRRHPNPMQIIPAILNSNPQAYKNTSKVK
jgi:hypothetical protein